MAEKKTTDTTTDKTTVDKTLNESTTDTTTVAADAATQGQVEKRGEVMVDEGADAHTLKEQSAEERLDDAKAEGLRNHAIEHADDDGDVNSRDKVSE